MPSRSKAQYKFMMMAAINKDFAKKRGLDQKVAQEWHNEDLKKKKEDPKWFEDLPDTAADGKDHSEEMESVNLALLW